MKIRFFEKYIKDCKNKKNFNRNKIKKEFPFLSVCICTFNSEKYVENAILSILNQSFQDFEIIIINDFSNDETFNIINQYKDDERFKIINHTKNFGIYRSRVDAIINSKGNYISFNILIIQITSKFKIIKINDIKKDKLNLSNFILEKNLFIT